MKPKISVIIPIYKVEPYLDRCVQSVLKQTFRDFEIILVDDGSPDNCPEMCDEYAEKNKCIRVLHKENGGLSDARNAGLEVAQGEYVAFVDSDDYVHPLYLEAMYKGIIDFGADISAVDYGKVHDLEPVLESLNIEDLKIEVMPADKAFARKLYTHGIGAQFNLVKLDIAKKYLFPTGRLFEDTFTTYKYYLSADKAAFIDNPLYNYYIRKDSIMSIRNKKFVCDLLDSSDCLEKGCIDSGSDILKRAARHKKFSNYCRVLLKTEDIESEYPTEYRRIIKYLDINKKDVLLNPNSRFKNKMAALLLYGGPGVLMNVSRIMNYLAKKRHQE